jgi:hypothetical protein
MIFNNKLPPQYFYPKMNKTKKNPFQRMSERIFFSYFLLSEKRMAAI